MLDAPILGVMARFWRDNFYCRPPIENRLARTIHLTQMNGNSEPIYRGTGPWRAVLHLMVPRVHAD